MISSFPVGCQCRVMNLSRVNVCAISTKLSRKTPQEYVLYTVDVCLRSWQDDTEQQLGSSAERWKLLQEFFARHLNISSSCGVEHTDQSITKRNGHFYSFYTLSVTLVKRHWTCKVNVVLFFFSIRHFTTLYEFEPPHSWGSEIIHKDTPQSVGLLWMCDQPVARTSTWQHTQHSQRTNIRGPGGIRTRNPSKRSAVDAPETARPLGLVKVVLYE